MSFSRLIALSLFGSLLLPVFTSAATFNDPGYLDQWYLERISSVGAWEVTSGHSQIIVAVLDSAISIDHPDLQENVWVNDLEIPDNGIDDDENGYIDDVSGWDFVDADADVRPDFSQNDELSHGTFVTGLIAAEANNETGYIGVAHKTSILPLRILDAEGQGHEEAAAQAVDYAVMQGARVINLSIAGSEVSSLLRNAIRKAYDAGVVVVAALGNEAQNVDDYPVYPACLGSETVDWVIGVAATDYFDAETDFTNYGATCADLSAPGEDMLGLSVYGEGRPEGGDVTWMGTSAATPLVAGAAALLLARYPDLTPEEVRIILKLSVDPVTSHLTEVNAIGVGRLNVAQALAVASSFSQAEALSEEIVFSVRPITSIGLRYLVTADVHDSSVHLYSGTGESVSVFTPYTATSSPISLALGDVAGSEVPEIITGSADGTAPLVRVFTTSGQVARAFFTGDQADVHGVRIAVGDIVDDTFAEIITATTGGSDVIVFSDTGEELLRFSPTGFSQEAMLTVAIADVDDDWDFEIIVAELHGDRVAVYDLDGTESSSFVGVPVGSSITALQIGDFDADYRDEIVIQSSAGMVFGYNRIGALNFAVLGSTGSTLHVADVSQDEIPDLLFGSVHGLTALTSLGDRLVLPSVLSVLPVGQSLVSW